MWTATKLISKNLIEICPKHLKTYICSVMQILTNSASCWGNEYIHMSTWIVGKDLKKNCCHRKNKFYSKLKTESITDTDYKHSKSVFEDSWLQNLGWHDDLYLQIYTCIYLHVVPSCFKMYLKVSPGLVLQTCLKKWIVKIKLLTDADMLLMVEKGIRSGICHALHR